MYPLGKLVGYPIHLNGKRALVVRVAEVPYPNVFVNRTTADHTTVLAPCKIEQMPALYRPEVYAKIPLVTRCPNATFLCQLNCPSGCQRCRPPNQT